MWVTSAAVEAKMRVTSAETFGNRTGANAHSPDRETGQQESSLESVLKYSTSRDQNLFFCPPGKTRMKIIC